MAKLMIALIRIYQRYISPGLRGHCRFYPTCSQYAVEALTKYGFIKGGALSVYRLLRCNPLCKGGYDPVEARGKRLEARSKMLEPRG